jgi:RNA polymerase sigma-70 factor (ECF subfamily)
MKNDISMELVKKARDGDMAAFEQIYIRTSGFVYNVALRITRNHADAEDVVQEVFINMHKNLPFFRFESSCSTWLYRITANTAISRCRKHSRETEAAAKYKEHLKVESQESPAHGPESAEEKEKIINAMLERLDDDQRACVVLRDMEGLSYDEIVQVLNIPLNTLRSRLHRAREALLEFAQKEIKP